MQIPADLEQLQRIELTLQRERIARYFRPEGSDKGHSFRMYIWNCALCEAFYIPLHFVEIAFRNTMQRQLLARLGPAWFECDSFLRLLSGRFASELLSAVAAERKQHGKGMTSHHVVSALTFGFWEHLLTKRFDRYLWAKGISRSFPNAPEGTTATDIHKVVESVRRWRNRIAHHHAIFDKGPMKKHADALKLLEWICLDTHRWVASMSRLPRTLSMRPKE